MKKVLIVGANSYIGESFAKYAGNRFSIDTVETVNNDWKTKSFSKYDCILHVAGIAHRTQAPELKQLYFSVNRDLAISVAQKAKAEGVKQFIFISSFSVYGKNTGRIRNIDKPSPQKNDYYGQSKYQAEQNINLLQSDDFNVALVRPPMVYGPGCKGNFHKLVNYTKKLSFFPNIDNQRSMIFIDNLSEFFSILIEKGCSGIFMPQDEEYVRTSSMVQEIAISLGKKLYITKIFNPFICFLMPYMPILQKCFGSLYYDESTKVGLLQDGWQVSSFNNSITKSILP